jgi:hypothetical protein
MSRYWLWFGILVLAIPVPHSRWWMHIGDVAVAALLGYRLGDARADSPAPTE